MKRFLFKTMLALGLVVAGDQLVAVVDVGPSPAHAWSAPGTTDRFLEEFAARWVVNNTRMTILNSQINPNRDTIKVTATRAGQTTPTTFYFDVRFARGLWSVVTPPRSVR